MTPGVERTSERARRYLRECIGEDVEELTGGTQMRFPFGSTQVSVDVSEDELQSMTFVSVRAAIADDVPISDELYRWMASASSGLLFGRIAFTPESENTLCQLRLTHTLLGDYLDLEELRSAVASLASTADHLDDIVVNRFGGRRFVDSD